jgi:hypothetical protein
VTFSFTASPSVSESILADWTFNISTVAGLGAAGFTTLFLTSSFGISNLIPS